MVTIKLTKDKIDTLQSYSEMIKELSEYGNEITTDQQRRIFERADELEDFFKQHNPTDRYIKNN